VPTAPVSLAGDKPLALAGLAAGRGASAKVQQGRGARVVTNVHFQSGMLSQWRRQEMWLKYSKKFSGRRRNCYRIAKQAVMDALKKKYKSRRQLKRKMRRNWIIRLNANSALHGNSYSRFITRCRYNNLNLNRKILAQIAIYDRPVFTSVMDHVDDTWRQRLEEKNKPPKQYTAEEMDQIAIPWIERQLPSMYTDTNVRFNRQVADHGAVEYTVDFGDPKMWREYLPQTPELANFNIPDHWIRDANRGMEPWNLEYLNFPGEKHDNKDYIQMARHAKASQLEEEEKKEKGEESRLTKEGSRDDWYGEESQSWFDN